MDKTDTWGRKCRTCIHKDVSSCDPPCLSCFFTCDNSEYQAIEEKPISNELTVTINGIEYVPKSYMPAEPTEKPPLATAEDIKAGAVLRDKYGPYRVVFVSGDIITVERHKEESYLEDVQISTLIGDALLRPASTLFERAHVGMPILSNNNNHYWVRCIDGCTRVITAVENLADIDNPCLDPKTAIIIDEDILNDMYSEVPWHEAIKEAEQCQK